MTNGQNEPCGKIVFQINDADLKYLYTGLSMTVIMYAIVHNNNT